MPKTYFTHDTGFTGFQTEGLEPECFWQCPKCEKCHDTHFPKQGCEWCNGVAVNHRMQLCRPPMPDKNPAMDTKAALVKFALGEMSASEVVQQHQNFATLEDSQYHSVESKLCKQDAETIRVFSAFLAEVGPLKTEADDD